MHVQLYAFGIREFCFIVGPGKRAIEDHFTPDDEILERLNKRDRKGTVAGLERFYRRVEDSSITWVNQARPLGFGHAVHLARPFVKDEPFLVHAGDAYVYSDGFSHLERMTRRFEEGAACVMALRKVGDPRQYGIAQGKVEEGWLRVTRVIEKLRSKKPCLAITPICVFSSEIMEAIEEAGTGAGGEVQLTDGIARLIVKGSPVYGTELKCGETWIDIGNPATYWEALLKSHAYAESSLRARPWTTDLLGPGSASRGSLQS